ncbi:MAG: hypothetical protein H0U65_15420 [Rubrobacter sp.]|nr:hypothetical protein [Rubrobacter sp.]
MFGSRLLYIWKMDIVYDHRGMPIRLTDGRKAHILEHPEMSGMEAGISDTLRRPESVVRSRSDEETRLYYRFHPETPVGAKFLCVVVKVRSED